MIIFEVFDRKIRGEFKIEPGSPVDALLMQGGELEAQRAQLQPGYTAAVERANALTARVCVPVRAAGPNGNAAQTAERERLLGEWREALAEENRRAGELSSLSRQVRAIQREVIDLLSPPATGERARREARDLVIKRRAPQ
jgi:hypothetical protein